MNKEHEQLYLEILSCIGGIQSSLRFTMDNYRNKFFASLVLADNDEKSYAELLSTLSHFSFHQLVQNDFYFGGCILGFLEYIYCKPEGLKDAVSELEMLLDGTHPDWIRKTFYFHSESRDKTEYMPWEVFVSYRYRGRFFGRKVVEKYTVYRDVGAIDASEIRKEIETVCGKQTYINSLNRLCLTEHRLPYLLSRLKQLVVLHKTV